jgi:hypothetical protein
MTRIRRFGAFTFALMVLISCKKQEGSTSAKIELYSRTIFIETTSYYDVGKCVEY